MYLNSNFSDTWKVSNRIRILLLLLLLILFLWHLQVQHLSLCYRMRFVILSAVCYKVDTNSFLGFHRLYYCKCSCVYILQRSTVALLCVFLAFLGLRRDFVSGFPTGRYFSVSWMNMYPDMCVNSAQKRVYVLRYNALSVTLEAAYRTLW